MRLSIRSKLSRRSSEEGGTLIEVLVSVLLLSFGLMGMLSAQGSSVAYQKIASVQMHATQLAIGLGDTARANSAGFKSGGFTWTLPYMSGALPADVTCGLSSACSAQEAATANLRNWLVEVRQSLPQGDAFTRPSADGSALEIWLMWQNTKTVGSISTEHTCAPEAIAISADKPYCIFLRVKT